MSHASCHDTDTAQPPVNDNDTDNNNNNAADQAGRQASRPLFSKTLSTTTNFFSCCAPQLSSLVFLWLFCLLSLSLSPTRSQQASGNNCRILSALDPMRTSFNSIRSDHLTALSLSLSLRLRSASRTRSESGSAHWLTAKRLNAHFTGARDKPDLRRLSLSLSFSSKQPERRQLTSQ